VQQPRRHARPDFHSHHFPEPTAAQLVLDRLQQVVSLVRTARSASRVTRKKSYSSITIPGRGIEVVGDHVFEQRERVAAAYRDEARQDLDGDFTRAKVVCPESGSLTIARG